MIPEGTILGELKVSKVHDYYDGPRLAEVVSDTGKRYLAFWVQSDANSDEWLYVDLKHLNTLPIRSIYSSFKNAPAGSVFRVTLRHRERDTCEPVEFKRVVDDLPTEDDLLFDTNKLPVIHADYDVVTAKILQDETVRIQDQAIIQLIREYWRLFTHVAPLPETGEIAVWRDGTPLASVKVVFRVEGYNFTGVIDHKIVPRSSFLATDIEEPSVQASFRTGVRTIVTDSQENSK